MKKILIITLVFVCFSVFAVAQRKTRSKTPAPIVQKKEIKSGLSIERYINNYELDSNGLATQTIEILQRLDSALLAEQLSVDETEFNSDLKDVEVLEAYKILPTGKKLDIEKSQIEVKLTPQSEAAPAFSSIKVLVVNFGKLKKGDSIFTKYKLKDKKLNFDGKFSELLYFPCFFDYKYAEVNLSAPIGYPIFFEAVDLEGGKIADINGRSRWQWKHQNSIGLPLSEFSSNYFDISPRLAISSYKSYEELGSFYWKEAKKQSAVTKEIQTLADKITDGIKEPKRQASEIYEWVNKNIRYLSIVLERGGWIPHDANSIIANGYGDCKDYTTLLQALLKAKGIESQPLLIGLDEITWFPKIASPELFNHVILYIPSLDVYADATAPNTRIGLISSTLHGKNGILAGDITGKHTIKDESATDNKFISKVNVTFLPNGDVHSVSNNSYVGQPEMMFRPMFADAEFISKSDIFVSTFLEYYGVKGRGKILNISNSHTVGEPFGVDLEIKLDKYVTFLSKGSFMLPTMLNLHNMLELEGLITAETRKTATIVGATTFSESFEIKVPEGINFEKLPPVSKVENSVGSFINEYKVDNGILRLTRELIIKKGIVQPEDYPKLVEIIKKTVEVFGSNISYVSTPLFTKTKNKKSTNSDIAKVNNQNQSLTVRESVQLENKLIKNPEDIEARKRLLSYYLNTKLTASKIKIIAQHQLWFIKNRPEETFSEVFGWYNFYETESDEYRLLKAEWLKELEKRKDSFKVQQNAFEFFQFKERELAEKIMINAEVLFPNKYEVPIALFNMYQTQSTIAENNGVKKPDYLQKAFEQGEKAIALLKQERSDTRDSKRAELLPQLGDIAIRLTNYEKATIFAKELVLEFGDDETEYEYADAAHKGNTLLGRISLKQGDLAKAKEYLLISVKALLRKNIYMFSDLNFELAKELFEKGEKVTVLEFLTFAEQIQGIDKVFIKSLQTEIKKGKNPSF